MKIPFLAGRPRHVPGIHNSVLAPCPGRPNCVCSDAANPENSISPLILNTPSDKAWMAIREAVLRLPRTRIVSESDVYLHVECRSALLGFVDDLELHLREQNNLIAVRSASRLGYRDFGVNRKRVEQLRAVLTAQGVTNSVTG